MENVQRKARKVMGGMKQPPSEKQLNRLNLWDGKQKIREETQKVECGKKETNCYLWSILMQESGSLSETGN